ncbi:hypothetical protein G4G27_02975 [Sphingomonas sp. So64.6b]|uniref:hypothetical protein n=1 Tax=Sphingomonas sp. So64.6b TaxID=2997354 RepID=UPI001601CBB3|nr:hypothetical protein [Sphingomonas sp. So64.6b]QNA83091.1 hypothetical protein G4G27_02975 [Sphingomonas sp. So64.6b]
MEMDARTIRIVAALNSAAEFPIAIADVRHARDMEEEWQVELPTSRTASMDRSRLDG